MADTAPQGSDTSRMKAILVVAATLAFVTSPLWSRGFGGFAPDVFPIPQDDPPAQPAGYAFSIWGVIYLWLVVHALTGLVRRADAADWDATRWPLIISLAVGAPWISVAQMSAVWATVLIWVMLLTALWALFSAPSRDRWLAAAPLGLYAGWLSAASFVALALTGAGFGILAGEVAWAWIVLPLALALAFWVQSRVPGIPEYGLAVGWAFVAIAVANLGSNLPVAIAAALAATLIVAKALGGLRRG